MWRFPLAESDARSPEPVRIPLVWYSCLDWQGMTAVTIGVVTLRWLGLTARGKPDWLKEISHDGVRVLWFPRAIQL